MKKLILVLLLSLSSLSLNARDIEVQKKMYQAEDEGRTEIARKNPKISEEQCENLERFIKISLENGYTVDETLDFLKGKLNQSEKIIRE